MILYFDNPLLISNRIVVMLLIRSGKTNS